MKHVCKHFCILWSFNDSAGIEGMLNKVLIFKEKSLVFQYQTATATAASVSIETTETENYLMWPACRFNYLTVHACR